MSKKLLLLLTVFVSTTSLFGGESLLQVRLADGGVVKVAQHHVSAFARLEDQAQTSQGAVVDLTTLTPETWGHLTVVADKKSKHELSQVAERLKTSQLARLLVAADALLLKSHKESDDKPVVDRVGIVRETFVNMIFGRHKFCPQAPLDKSEAIKSIDANPALLDQITRNIFSQTPWHVVGIFNHSNTVQTVRFDNKGRLLTASQDKTAQVWDIATGKTVLVLKHPDGVFNAEFNAVGDQIITACNDGTARQWNAQSGVQTGTYTHGDINYGASFNPAGDRVATCGYNSKTILWNAQTKEKIQEFSDTGAVYNVAFSPDGRYLATASADGTAVVWNLDGTKKFTCPHEHTVFDASWSPDTFYLGTGSNDRTAKLWDVSSGGGCFLTLQHSDPVYSVDFGPDRETGPVLTASADGKARVWDPTPGAPRPAELPHDTYVFNARFNNDASLIATAAGNVARVWSSAAKFLEANNIKITSLAQLLDYHRAVKNGSALAWAKAQLPHASGGVCSVQ